MPLRPLLPWLLVLLAFGACKRQLDPGDLSQSRWEGQVNSRGTIRPFVLTLEKVQGGRMEGVLSWKDGRAVAVEGTLTGNHLVFSERPGPGADPSRKDIYVIGARMEGTDRDGTAAFSAIRQGSSHEVGLTRLAPPPPEDPRSAYTLRVLDVASGNEVLRVGEPLAGPGVVFSPDGQVLATVHPNKVELLAVPEGKPLATLPGLALGLAFSSTGGRLAVWRQEDELAIHDPRTGALVVSLKAPEGQRLTTFALEDRVLAAGTASGALLLYRLPAGGAPTVLEGHQRSVTGLAFLPGASSLASVALDDTVRRWDWEKGQEQLVIKAPEEKGFGTVAFSPSGQRFAAGAGLKGRALRLYNLQDGSLVATLREGALPSRFAFSADGRRLVSWGDRQRLSLWDAATGQLAYELPGDYQQPTAVSFSAGAEVVAAVQGDTLWIWRGKQPRPLADARWQFEAVAVEGRLVAATGSNLQELLRRASEKARPAP